MPTCSAAILVSVFLATRNSASRGRKFLRSVLQIGHLQTAVVGDDRQLGPLKLIGQFIDLIRLLRCWHGTLLLAGTGLPTLASPSVKAMSTTNDTPGASDPGRETHQPSTRRNAISRGLGRKLSGFPHRLSSAAMRCLAFGESTGRYACAAASPVVGATSSAMPGAIVLVIVECTAVDALGATRLGALHRVDEGVEVVANLLFGEALLADPEVDNAGAVVAELDAAALELSQRRPARSSALRTTVPERGFGIRPRRPRIRPRPPTLPI